MEAAQRKNAHTFSKRFLLFLLVAACLYCLFSYVAASVTYRLETNTLVKELGINLDDYGSVTTYFLQTLEPGMPIEVVYAQVRGYKRVQRCSAYTEIYYYYSSDIDKAERFGIWYDEEYRFDHLVSEDSDSATLANVGDLCVDRRLK